MTDKADIPFIASRLREAATLLERCGTTAWETTEEWRRGAGVASYNPESGGNRWEEDDDGTVWPVITDPTGDRALTPEEVNKAHQKYRDDLAGALRLADALITDVHTATPHKPSHIADHERLAAQVGAEGWCSSCYRNGGKLYPQAMHPDGTVKYRGSCRWCMDFEKANGRKPPMSLLQAHHAGRRITPEMVAKSLGLKVA